MIEPTSLSAESRSPDYIPWTRIRDAVDAVAWKPNWVAEDSSIVSTGKELPTKERTTTGNVIFSQWRIFQWLFNSRSREGLRRLTYKELKDADTPNPNLHMPIESWT